MYTIVVIKRMNKREWKKKKNDDDGNETRLQRYSCERFPKHNFHRFAHEDGLGGGKFTTNKHHAENAYNLRASKGKRDWGPQRTVYNIYRVCARARYAMMALEHNETLRQCMRVNRVHRGAMYARRWYIGSLAVKHRDHTHSPRRLLYIII